MSLPEMPVQKLNLKMRVPAVSSQTRRSDFLSGDFDEKTSAALDATFDRSVHDVDSGVADTARGMFAGDQNHCPPFRPEGRTIWSHELLRRNYRRPAVAFTSR